MGGISCLSSQETARMGISVGVAGITTGLAATLAYMNPADIGKEYESSILKSSIIVYLVAFLCSATYGQLMLMAGSGGAAGYLVAQRIGPAELPQAVAAFHSLVGLAATATAVGDFMAHDPAVHASMFHNISTYLGAWMGSITFTGSLIAYGKLAEKLSSAAMNLPGRDMINVSLAASSVLGMGTFMVTGDPTLAAAALGTGVVSSGVLGLHMTNSIGGADMPVVITLLNSYSGWALCAEGFILDQPILTVIGALIGSSGAFLTRIMCEAMNRSLPNVIMGGFGTSSTVAKAADGPKVVLTHTEINATEAAESLKNAEKIVIVPGYGLAVAQAAGVVVRFFKHGDIALCPLICHSIFRRKLR